MLNSEIGPAEEIYDTEFDLSNEIIKDSLMGHLSYKLMGHISYKLMGHLSIMSIGH